MARPRSFDRDAALEQAMLAFWEQGYEQTSIADLTAAMGIAAPSLYAAFGDKRALFDEAVALYEQLPSAAISDGLALPAVRGAVERMLHNAAVQYTADDRPRGCFIVAEPLLERQRAGSDAQVRERLRRGVADGELAPGTDVDALAAYISVIVAGMSARARDGATRAELEAVAATAMRAWPDRA